MIITLEHPKNMTNDEILILGLLLNDGKKKLVSYEHADDPRLRYICIDDYKVPVKLKENGIPEINDTIREHLIRVLTTISHKWY